MLLLLPVVTWLLSTVESAKEKDCSPFPFVSLEHGRIVRTGYQRYFFGCKEGHFLASPSKIRCYRGNWTSTQEPKCLKKEGMCDDPPKVANAVVHGADRSIGDSVRYVCDPGFTMLGRGELTCTAGGHWRKRTPTCMDENEPLEKVAERLKNSFVNEIGTYTDGSPQGRLLDRASMLHGLELVLLIDRSSSVDPVHLEDAKHFVKFLLRRFGVKNGDHNKAGTRAAVLTFGTEVQMVFNVDNENITGPDAANQVVDTIQPNGGGTNMEGALTKVIIKVAHKLRPKAKRALFLMTDGEPNIANPEITPQDMAEQLKQRHDFEIFTVGVGKGINQRLLADLGSEPPLSHVFVLTEYPDLNEIIKVVEDDQPPAAPISPEQCGYKTPEEDRPWLAVVYVSGGPMKVCGGVLICRQWVLTAASCIQDGEERVHNQDVFVSLGERDLTRDERGQTNFYAVDISVHPEFDVSDPLKNNLALINLNLPAARNRPVCLPRTDGSKPLHLDLNVNASIAGWGLKGDRGPTVVSGDSVQFNMETSPASLSEEDECPGKRKGMALICAGQGTQTCLGLMGSPLIAVDSTTGLHHVLGVASGRRYCLKGHNQYVELTRNLRWINQQTKLCQLTHWGM